MFAFTTLITLFAKPLGAVVNKALASGSAAVLAYGVAKGWDAFGWSMIVSEITLALSTIISGFAASQGIQIPIINDDKTNGVAVVPASEAKKAGISKTDSPLPPKS